MIVQISKNFIQVEFNFIYFKVELIFYMIIMAGISQMILRILHLIVTQSK